MTLRIFSPKFLLLLDIHLLILLLPFSLSSLPPIPSRSVELVAKTGSEVSADSSIADFNNFEKIGKRDAENVIEKPIVKKQKIEQKEQNSIKRLSALTKTKFEAPPAPKEKSTSASFDKVSFDHSCFVEYASVF